MVRTRIKVNGFGTSFYGWRHFPDGTSTPTRWACFFYLPVIPLARLKLRVLTDFQSEKFFPKTTKTTKAALFPLVKFGVFAIEDRFQVVQPLALSGREVLMTYVRTFVLMPLAMLWPLSVLFAVGSIGQARHLVDAMWFTWVLLILGIAAIGNVLVIAIWAIRRSRGMGSASASATRGTGS